MLTLVPVAPYVLIPLAALCTGFSEKAIRRKIEDGVWVDGREYRYGPDGHIYISIKGYCTWVEQGRGSKSANDPSASASPSTASRNGTR
jgi:hypothetical protein